MDVTSPTQQTSTTSQQSKKRSHSTSKPGQQPLPKTLTLRNPPWSYIRLQQHQHPQSSNTSTLDALTAHIQITAALHQFLGVHGAAVPIDVLKLEGSEVWIRVPADDRSALGLFDGATE